MNAKLKELSEKAQIQLRKQGFEISNIFTLSIVANLMAGFALAEYIAIKNDPCQIIGCEASSPNITGTCKRCGKTLYFADYRGLAVKIIKDCPHPFEKVISLGNSHTCAQCGQNI